MLKLSRSRRIARSLVAWLSIALGSIFIYLSVGQLLVLFVTPSGMSSSPSQSARDFVGQYGQTIGLLLIFAGQLIRGRRPRLKLRRMPHLGRAILLLALISGTQMPIARSLRPIVPVFAWGGATHKVTLTEAAIDMAVAYERFGVYQYRELDWKTGFGEYVKDGSTKEDDAPNDVYHFYDPSTGSGLKWEWYFPLRTVLEGGGFVIEPHGGQFPNVKEGYFPNAYQRARYGGGYYLGDKLNWYGALKAYDYTPESKQVAYNRLGHVAHLLEDMAEPDHANLAAHPGSSKSKSEILGMVVPLAGIIIGLVVGGIFPALLCDLLAKAMAKFLVLWTGERYGFEKLVIERSVSNGKFLLARAEAENYGKSLKPLEPEYRASLKAYFDHMATEAQFESATSNLLGPKGRTALGVDNLNIDEIKDPFLGITLFKGFPKGQGIPIVPAIDPTDPADMKPYDDLTNSLGTKAMVRTAGLLIWFYDIVDFPPYVKQLNITQGGEVKYRVEWEDQRQFDNDIGADRVTYRKPITSINKTLESGKVVEVNVLFGPIGGKDIPVPKKILRPEVKIGGVEVDGTLVADNVWRGQYTPQLAGCKEELKDIEIFAADRESHHTQGSDEDEGHRLDGHYGNILDSDPASPAKLLYHDWPRPPYQWTAYTPGWDKDHYKVVVGPSLKFASVTPDEASLLAHDGQSYHFTITMANGPADVKLKAQGVPPGAQAEFYPSASVHVPPSPNYVNVIMKITVSSVTPVGTYKIQIVDEGYTPPPATGLLALLPCYPVVTLNVKPFMPVQPAADFTISADPSSSTVEPGSSTTTKIRVSTVTQPFYGMPVSLSLLSPAGFTVTLSPPPASGQPPFEKMMEVKVASTVEAGKSYQITVTGTGTDGKTHSAIFTVLVKRPVSRGDFAIGVYPSSSTVQAGFYTTAQVEVTSTALPDVYDLPVTLSYSAPQGFMVTFSPPPPSGVPLFTKLMQVTVQPTVQPGSYTVTVIGTGTDLRVRTAPFTVVVTAPPPQFNYAISTSSALQSVIKGQTATYTVAITIISGSTQPVSLSLRGLPSGATFNFRPSTGNPTFTSTLLVTTTTQTPRGDYTLTIMASAGGVVRSTTVTLRVVEFVR